MKKTLTLALVLAMGCFAGRYIEASNQDPLVSLSYLNQRLEALKTQDKSGGNGNLTVVNLEKGQEIIGAQGSQFILRAGQVEAIVSDKGGLSDVTGAKDLIKGEKAKANHLLLIPRSDGRGLRARTSAIVLVQGTYHVQ